MLIEFEQEDPVVQDQLILGYLIGADVYRAEIGEIYELQEDAFLVIVHCNAALLIRPGKRDLSIWTPLELIDMYEPETEVRKLEGFTLKMILVPPAHS